MKRLDGGTGIRRGEWRIAVAVIAAAILAGCARPPAEPHGPVTTGGFRDALPGSGIRFDMQFLPNEQGETYKVNLYDHGSGIAVGDYDGDGADDLYFLNQMGANALLRNRGDGTFEDATTAAGVKVGDRICVSAAFADYDNDGRQDLFITSVRGGNLLYHNEGGGKFKDVTKQAGVEHVGHSQAALFFDYDRDGYLDLFVTNTAGWTTNQYNTQGGYFTGFSTLQETMTSPKERNLLYRNNRKGGFTDVTAGSGLEGRGWAADAAAFDYDEDGLQDLIVSNMFGRAQLYRNVGSGRFTDVTERALGATSWGGMGVKPFDYNGDGRLDIFMTDMHSDMWVAPETPPTAVQENVKYTSPKGRMAGPGGAAGTAGPAGSGSAGGLLYGNTLFRAEGGGRFTEVSDRAGVETFWPWGAAAGDFDNDGDADLFVPSGMGYPFFYWRNYLLMNQGGEFTDRSAAEGLDPPPGGIHLEQKIAGKAAVKSSRCAVAADLDGDGRLDLVVNNFNDRPYYYRNAFPEKGWLELSLRGTRSNRDALGAVVRLYAGESRMVRIVEGFSGYLACSSKIVHFGLGDIAKVDRIEILWPSGARQTVPNPEINRRLQITEPAS